jgi:hypothetical protein
VLVTIDPADEEAFHDLVALCRVPARKLGTTGGGELVIHLRAQTWRWPVAGLFETWDGALGALMGTVAEPLAAH